MQIVLILNNIRSSENVGSIFRTADAAGVYKIYICGYTPAPTDKFGRVNKALAKASLGAEKFVEWEKAKNLKSLISNLKTEKFKIIGVEQSPKSKNYKLLTTNANLAFVFGNEVKGLSKKDLSLCDQIVEIP
ncbi:MAG: TrmH family RNA methyltransferase, partial [Patescibacteria group bacterium]